MTAPATPPPASTVAGQPRTRPVGFCQCLSHRAHTAAGTPAGCGGWQSTVTAVRPGCRGRACRDPGSGPESGFR